MAKHLNISLGVTADTSKAKAQLQDLQNQLTKIINSPTSNRMDLAKEIREASQAAAELQAHLKNATNVDTGTLDFTKLSNSLKQSGQTLESYAQKLVRVGPEGRQAFQQLTTSVAQSEIPIKRVNKQLTEMWTTLKNSARWQISSSILHGFMGAVSSAYGYAQDLNESLTNIRIVTGQNTDQMAKFAKQANAAAKALSTTTTRYTNASLIYYQQGLSDEEVKKRTDITVKMANAAGASAETVSDQLTAVWNNFYDGTKSLEHYADVMTALGAATASSTDEIAGGLEKFAAVADTIGLSYEYAASALATITSNTRQSEEVVGTALKTIFARIQGLNLGETLEDGTSLNKYSEALAKVGIDIFETNGEIKKMDNILNELGAKWQQLGKDQQIALAQTVAGVRQYNQLVSLMDNWNNGDNDSFQANMETARNSTGALQKQADIYAESWEAASDRVRASMEGIYETIIDDDMFIGILDGLAEIVQYTDRLIDGMGGLGGVISTVGAIGTKVFSKQIAQQMRDTAYGISMMTEGGKKKYREQKQKEVDKLTGMASSLQSKSKTEETKVWATGIENSAKLRTILEQNSANMTPEQIKVAQARIEASERTAKDVEESARRFDESKTVGKKLHDEVLSTTKKNALVMNPQDGNEVKKQVSENDQAYKELEQRYKQYYSQLRRIDEIIDTETIDKDTANRMNQLATDLKETLSSDFDLIDPELGGTVTQSIKEDFLRLKEVIEEKIENDIANLGLFDNDLEQKIKENIKTQGSNLAETEQKKENQKQEQEENEKFIKEQGNEGRVYDWADKATAVADAALSLTSAIQALGGIKDVLSDDTLSGWEKFSSIVSVVAMNVPMLLSSFTQLSTVFGGTAGAIKGLNAVTAFLNPSLAATGVASGAAATGIGGLASAFGSLMIAAAPWLAIAALVVGSIIAIDEAFVTEKEAADEAAKSAKKLAEEYDRVNESYQNLKNTLSNYQEAKDGISELTKGTQEYKEAILAANEQALTLLETNKGLEYTVDDNGLINIDNEALEKLQQERLEGLTNAQNMKILSKQKAAETSVDLERSKLKSGANKETTFNVLANAYNNGNTAMFASDEIFETELLKIFENMRPGDDALEALVKEREAIEKLILEINKNTAVQESNNKLIVQNSFGEEISNSGLGQGGQDLLTAVLGSSISQYKSEHLDKYNKTGEYQWDAMGSAKALGESYGYTLKEFNGAGGATYSYTDANGKELETSFTIDEIIDFAILQDASNEISGELQNHIDTIAEGTKNLTDAQTEVLSSFANGQIGDLSKLTANEIKAIEENLGGGLKDLINLLNNGQDIGDAFEQAKANIEQAEKNLIESLKFEHKIETDEGGFVDAQVNDVSDALGRLLKDSLNNVSQDTKEQVGNILKTAFLEGGSEGLTVAEELFRAAGDNAQEVANIVSGMDWQNATLEDFNNKLDEAGIDLTNASSALANFVAWIEKVRGVATAASNSDYYNNTQEVLEQMVAGGTLSAEKIEELRKGSDQDRAIADTFEYQADGTYVYSGSNADAAMAEEYFKQQYNDRFIGSAQGYYEEAQRLEGLKGNYNNLSQRSDGTNSELIEQQMFAIENLLKDKLSESEQAKYAQLMNKSSEDMGFFDRQFLANIIRNNEDAFSDSNIDRATEDSRFEAEKNMQAAYSVQESPEDIDGVTEALGHNAEAMEAAAAAKEKLNNTTLEELGIEREELEELAEAYIEAGDSIEEAYRKAEEALRLNSGLERLIDNWKTYNKVLQEGSESSPEYVKTMNEMQSILSDITGVTDKEIFTKEWIKKNQSNLDQLAKGSTKAISKIRKAAADEILVKASGVESFDQVADDFKEIHNYLWDYARNNNIEIGAKIDNAQFLDACNEIVAAAGFTAEQAGEYFKALGYNVEVETQEKKEESEIAYDGQWFDTMTGEPKEIHTKLKRTETLKVPVVKSITYTGEGGGKVNFSNTAAGGAGSSGGGGGGSDEPTQMEYTKEIDFYDRYKEWDDALDDIEDVLSDIQKEEDALYGQNKISAMKKHNKMLLEEVEALQQKKKEALAYFEIDKQNLQNAAGALGYNIDFGSRDQILNYTSTMQGLFDELHAMEVHFNSLGSGKAQQQYKKDVLDPFNQKVDDLKQYIDQYDETRELLEDLDNQITDSILEWKGLNYDILHYELEIKIEINDIALTRLDYYLKKYEDDFYSVSEAAAYLTSRFEPVLNKLAAYEELYRDTTKMWDSTTQLYGDIMEGVDETIHQSNEERLDAMSGGLVGAFTGNGVVEHDPTDFYTQTENGIPIAVGEEGYINALDRDITQADYVEGLYESFEGIFEELGELVDMDKQMMEFYANAIEMAREELEFYTNSLEHLTNALKHYHKVADITGRTNDYGFMGKMLEAQSAAIENELSVASSNYEMWKQQKAYWEAQLLTAEEGTKQWEFYKENLDAAVKATEEAQEEMLSKTEEWAESLRAILEHELGDAARILENALTGGTSFDTMNTALERAESLQEEYLTDTNKIYETTKLMRQAQQQIDKTNNNNAKLRLNMFITETEQLQQQNRLSEYELSIQQAKYQLLLAELALEEAKNAKSTVRLKRDFEGNFGYVYTADQEQIDDALQNLDDKRNELYNIGLEGANNYTSKYLQTLQAMYDEFTTIQQNYLEGMYESEEEYQNALLDAYDYYYEQLKNYEELYGIAIRADSRVTADAWSTDFQDMIYSTEIWADECDIYITQVTELFEEWAETSEDLNQILDNTTGTIDEIVRASDELAASINDHVVPGLQQELDLLNEILRAYGLIRDKVFEDINHYEDTADEIYDDIVEEAERNDYEDEEFEQEYPEKADRVNTPAASSPSGNKGNPETGAGGTWTYVEEKKLQDAKAAMEGAKYDVQTSKGSDKEEAQERYNQAKKEYEGWLNTKEVFTGATGGYTGAWGPEGKLAVLHEKEIVLNKSDTENILQAVDMVRQISTGIDEQASYQRIATLITQTLQDKREQEILEQYVTIEARFDNVRDRYEIEAAFDNLINKASQYANRNKI